MSSSDDFAWWCYPRDTTVNRLAECVADQLLEFAIEMRKGNPHLPVRALDYFHALEETNRELRTQLRVLRDEQTAHNRLYQLIIINGQCP